MTKLHIRSEIAFSTIRRLFRDPYSEIKLGTLIRLAEILGVHSSELYEEEET